MLTILAWVVMQGRVRRRSEEKLRRRTTLWSEGEGKGDVEGGNLKRLDLDLGRVKTAGGEEVDRMAVGDGDGRRGFWGSWR